MEYTCLNGCFHYVYCFGHLTWALWAQLCEVTRFWRYSSEELYYHHVHPAVVLELHVHLLFLSSLFQFNWLIEPLVVVLNTCSGIVSIYHFGSVSAVLLG